MTDEVGDGAVSSGDAVVGVLRSILPTRLRTKLAWSLALAMFLAVVLLGTMLVGRVEAREGDWAVESLAGQARTVAAVVSQTAPGPGSIAKAVGANPLDGTDFWLIAPDGEVVDRSVGAPALATNQAGRPEVVEARERGVGSSVRRTGSPDDAVVVVAAVLSHPGWFVRAATPFSQVHTGWSELRNDVLLAALVSSALAGLLGAWMAGRITDPLDDLRRQAAAIAAGRLDARSTPASTKELGDLSRSFNAMGAQLRSTLEERDLAQDRMAYTLANLSDGVVITDWRGNVVRTNRAAARMLGASGAAVGQRFVEVVRDHELAAALRSAMQDPTCRPVERTVMLRQTQRTVQAVAQRVETVHEELGLVVLRDVTELRQLEGIRREFVANVSHELRTPLASIRALVETLEAGAAHDPEVAGDFYARIVGEVDRLTAIVEDLLDIARLESGQLRLHRVPADLRKLLPAAAERLRPQIERAGLALTVDVEAGLPPVPVDPARFEQVVVNLVHNAVKFTPAGGAISVVARRSDGRAEVAVRDTGQGIAPEDLPRLFERFYKTDRSRHSEGTGLGLAIAKHIVLAHGGDIWAESAPGEGSTFRFTLPLVGPDSDAGGTVDRVVGTTKRPV